MLTTLTLISAALALAAGPDQMLKPWASKAEPSDVAKRHVEEIAAGQLQYTVAHGGTMDGANCRSPMGCGINREGAIEQTWQSNRAVRMENVGQSDVVNPWLSNGRNNFRTMDEIVAAAVSPGMSDKEKAHALWFQQIRHRFHRSGDQELGDPVKVFNVYGHNPCGSDAIMMGGLWRKAGLKGAPVRLVSHAIAQSAYDGGWHVMDGDLDGIFLLRDNETLASDRDIARDHDLVKRTHTYGILVGDNRAVDEKYSAMFVSEDEIKGDRRCQEDTTMNMTLRPGEALVWRWGRVDPPKYMFGNTQPDYPDTVCNGLWEYRPDFSNDLWKKGTTSAENVKSGPEGLSAEEGKTGTIVWVMRSPYVFVGGRLETESSDATFAVSADGKKWEDVKGPNFDKFFPPSGPARYQYQVRCQLKGGAKLKRLAIINDLQMALLALPEMTVGQNAFTYTDKSAGERKVRITHEWVERSTSRPPEAPPSPVSPSDGGESSGTDIVFQWNTPEDPDGDKIADYHFELADRADMKWPLSMSFDKLISRSADKGKAQYTLPYLGLLTPDKQYYWHVRAKDAKGVWGPWSKTWSFTPRGPSYPLEVTLNYDQSSGVGTLRWKPNPVGRQPAKCRVYGSDEKGFSVSDVPYKVNVGTSKELSPQFPANFIAETAATELAVIGAQVDLPNANKTYYRVVAVDQQQERSGPSDYAAAPRPVIYSKPAVAGKVGGEYRYQISANRSLGDLRMRSPEVVNFWDVEKPKFALEQGPKWLKLDAATGLLSGKPDASGKFEVAVTATIDREVRKLDDAKLGWGQEAVVSKTTERVGSSTQRFVIEVGP